MKKTLSVMLAFVMLFLLAACGEGGGPDGNSNSKGGNAVNVDADDTVEIGILCAEDEREFLLERIEAFRSAYSDHEFSITVDMKPEAASDDAVPDDFKVSADIYAFSCDHLTDLVDAGGLLAIDDTIDAVLKTYADKSLADVKSANSEASVLAATVGDIMYAFPMGVCDDSFLCLGVNPNVKNAGWAVVLAEFLTNEESQTARYNACQILPTNTAVEAFIQVTSDYRAEDETE